MKLGDFAGPLLALALFGPLRAQDLYDSSTVRSFHITTHQGDWWNQLIQNRKAKIDLAVDLTVDNRTYKGVGLRFRGMSSYLATGSSKKKSFNVTMDAFTPDQDLLGYDSLNLSNSYNDPTFTREVVGYELLRRYLPAPKANYIKLYINNEYWGVYVNVQQPDKRMVREWFRGNEGNRYRCDPPQASGQGKSALQWLGENLDLYKAAYELKNQNSPTGWVDVRELCRVLNNTSSGQLPQELPKVLDVDRALWYLVVNNIVVNLDCYIGRGNDYYLYHDEEHDRFAMMPWDFNESFGGYNARMSVAALKRLDIFWQETNTRDRPLMARVLANATWRARYLAHYRTVLEEVFDWTWIGGRITQYQAMIEKDVQADAKKLYPMSMFKGGLTTDYQLNSSWFRTWVPGLKPFVEERRNYLLSRSDLRRATPAVDQVAHTPARPKDKEVVWVTARVASATSVALHTRVAGPFASTVMYDDGKHHDGAANDGVYGAMISGQPAGTDVEYYVGATSAGGVRFAPRTAGHQPHRYRVEWPRGQSAVLLNEFLARNNKGIVDEKSQHEDWIELFNSSAQEADLSGLHLTDDRTKPTKWAIPAGTKLAPGQALIVWADDDPGDGPLHATFKLSAAGEEIGLFAADGRTLLDEVSFGLQEADISAGRLFDAKPGWVGYPTPTPRALNAPKVCGWRPYTALEPASHTMKEGLAGSPKIGSQVTIQIREAPANSAVAGLFGGSGTTVPVAGQTITLLVGNPLLGLLILPTSAGGAVDLPLPIPGDPQLVGVRLYVQTIGVGTGGLLSSNAVELTICPK